MTSLSRRHLVKAGLALAVGEFVRGSGKTLYARAAGVGAPPPSASFPPGALPSRSDIAMSVRSYHPDALNQLAAFHATRCEWMYSDDANWVTSVKKIVKHVGLTLNATHRIEKDPGVAQDVDGKPIVAPWMKAAGNNTPWNSVFKPAARDNLWSTLKQNVAIGANSIQFDDPRLEQALVDFAGGDFSPEALAAFKSYCQSAAGAGACRDLAGDDYDMGKWVRRRAGTQSAVDWRAFKQQHGSDPAWQAWNSFMRNGTVSFLGSIRQYLHTQPNPLPLSMNVSDLLPMESMTFLLDLCDYLVPEIDQLTKAHVLTLHHACAAAWQLPFVPSITPVSTADSQWAIALSYALGDNPLVPWGAWVPGHDKNYRYYGTVSDFGYLFDFVRANAGYFDGYDEIADLAMVADEASLPKSTCYDLAFRALGMGAIFRFAVARTNGRVTADRAAAFPPQAAVAVNAPPSKVKEIYPSIPVVTLADVNGHWTNPALRRVFRIMSPDPQNIVAVPRVNKRSGTLLIHVVDASKSNQTLSDSQFLDVAVPQAYWPYVEGAQNALLLRPRGGSLKKRLESKRNGDNLNIRVPLGGISGWGILVLDRHLS